MRAPFALLPIAVLAGGCLLADDHVSTEILAICTDDLPLPFAPDGDRMVASLEIKGVDYQAEPDAFAGLDTFSLDPISGVSDLGFVDSLTIELHADGLPDVQVAELDAPGPALPVVGEGVGDANLVDYLTQETVLMSLALSGPAPSDAFVLRFQACLKAHGLKVEDKKTP